MLLGVLAPTVGGVAMERVLNGLELVATLTGGEDVGLGALMDAVNQTVAVDLNGILPYSASRETVIGFTLIERGRGAFELKTAAWIGQPPALARSERAGSLSATALRGAVFTTWTPAPTDSI